jgi:hypothetical protein
MLRRRLLGVLAVVSLVLCGITLVAWVRSYWNYDELASPERNGRSYQIASERGEVQFSVVRSLTPTTDLGWAFTTAHLSQATGSPWGQRPVYGFRTGRMSLVVNGVPSADGWFIVVSDWLLVLITAVLPALWIRQLWAHLPRYRVGLCPACGYDLRATPGRCPECNWRESERTRSKPRGV